MTTITFKALPCPLPTRFSRLLKEASVGISGLQRMSPSQQAAQISTLDAIITGIREEVGEEFTREEFAVCKLTVTGDEHDQQLYLWEE